MRTLFPDLSGRWAEVNLNTKAKKMFPSDMYKSNPLLDPEICQVFVNDVHRREDVDFSYGGYLEDRSYLWRGHYQEVMRAFTHLGVDFNVPAKTTVAAPVLSEVVYTLKDDDVNGGWGGMVVLKTCYTRDHYLLGHLKKDRLPKVGETIETGDPVGVVAKYPENGKWYPHLHMQMLSRKLLGNGIDFGSLDGYSVWDKNLEELYPNPMRLVK